MWPAGSLLCAAKDNSLIHNPLPCDSPPVKEQWRSLSFLHTAAETAAQPARKDLQGDLTAQKTVKQSNERHFTR